MLMSLNPVPVGGDPTPLVMYNPPAVVAHSSAAVLSVPTMPSSCAMLRERLPNFRANLSL